ncbi:uncharacterized protein LOC134190346 [Corticium candelabrum]|uniref:uncharacterized protein LOC134190346 n=1 Tax=Corticium candelabrum TaxID=121492 RepID=UPI002E2585DE|nr:uncharacterized protein LOC134190346 [Corticium candelabrum]
MRVQQDQQQFSKWVLKLGNGQLLKVCDDAPPETVDIPTECLVSDNIIDTVFADLPSALTTTVLLTPKMKHHFMALNNHVLARLEDEKRLYLSVDRVICDIREKEQNYPRALEFIYSLTPSGLPEHSLYLKVGCIIILLRNLDLRNGLCNGTRLIVRHLHNHVIDAESHSYT